jgi:predicted ATPase
VTSEEPLDLTPSWEQKPVAVLAIELTFPWHAGLEAIGYEPWTMAHRWEQRIVERVRGFGGMLIQRSPSLLLVAFGVPQVVELLPQRAIQAALAIRRLATAAEGAEDTEASPELRQAVHLGTALVGGRTHASVEQLVAVGDTLALPVRLLGQAAPGEIMLSPTLGRLVMGWYELQALPLPEGDGLSSPVGVYRMRGLMPRRSPRAGVGVQSVSLFVGRERELTTLHELLAQVREGRGQAVGIVGEPGMGKSRLLSEFRQRLAGTGVTYLIGHCLSYGSTVPYLPVLDLLRDHCGITETDAPAQISAKVHVALQEVGMALDEWAPYLFHLLGLPGGTDDLAEISPEALKRRTFEALRQMSLHASQRHPLILAVEDLQWIDPSSADFFASLVECLAGASILFVATYRPGYQPPWLGQSYAAQLGLPPLVPQDSRRVVQAICQAAPLPERIAQVILAKAQGNPFFLEEIVQTLVDQGVVVRHPGAGTDVKSSPTTMSLPDIRIPATVQGVLAARIDRLPAQAKALLQTLAVTGYTCSFRLLTQLVDRPDGELHRLLAQLQGAEFIYEQPNAPGPVYIFKHALTRDMAYHMLSPVRRQALHERTAQAIEALWSHRLEEQYGELAYHYSRSRNITQAVAYLQRAGQQAVECSAHVEAIAYLTRGLELLQTLPTTPARTQQELVLQTTLGPALMATKGFAAPDVEHTYARAWELCQQVGETPELFPVLLGLRRWYFVRAEMDKARQLGEQLLALAELTHDSACLLEAHRAVGTTLFFLGELAPARAHLEQGITLYEAQRQRTHARLYGLDAGVTCLVHAAHVLWALGYFDQAQQRSETGLALARKLTHPFSLAYALAHAAWLAQFCREAPAVQAQAGELITLSQAHGFPLRAAQGMLWRGWALAEQNQQDEGIAQMRQGLAAWQATGAELGRPYFLALFAEAYRKSGQVDEGLNMLAEALTAVEKTGEQFYKAELQRLRGELLLARAAAPQGEAETCLRQALGVAHRQQAKALELRAVLSLSRLWQHQGKREAARQQLAEIRGWFTEGFDTADLQETMALLKTLA